MRGRMARCRMLGVVETSRLCMLAGRTREILPGLLLASCTLTGRMVRQRRRCILPVKHEMTGWVVLGEEAWLQAPKTIGMKLGLLTGATIACLMETQAFETLHFLIGAITTPQQATVAGTWVIGTTCVSAICVKLLLRRCVKLLRRRCVKHLNLPHALHRGVYHRLAAAERRIPTMLRHCPPGMPALGPRHLLLVQEEEHQVDLVRGRWRQAVWHVMRRVMTLVMTREMTREMM
mmetsp:Transcript_55241/g.81134  ORF Transcript_55241/g.81134 Transcript_55241/m.81134 type:complete len:234 (+) Transcript_55241:1635-2336(+)